jgi:hypothetical protein
MGRLSIARFAALIAALAAILLSVGIAWADEKPSGTITIEETEFRLIIGGDWGHGTLRLQGQDYKFKIKGLTAGGIGAGSIHAKGKVYNLDQPSDLAGDYAAATAGLTVGMGKGVYSFTNGATGVRMDLKTSSEGVELALGVGGMTIKMDE